MHFKIVIASCRCGGNYAYMIEQPSGAWEMYGCICHNAPPVGVMNASHPLHPIPSRPDSDKKINGYILVYIHYWSKWEAFPMINRGYEICNCVVCRTAYSEKYGNNFDKIQYLIDSVVSI